MPRLTSAWPARLSACLPACAAALALLLAAMAVPAHADRGDRHARVDRGGHSHGHGHWRGAVVVRPAFGPVVRGGWVRPVAPAYHGRPYHSPHYGPHYGPHYRSHDRPHYGLHYGPHYPRLGLVIDHRPALWTLVTVGALSYVLANGVYYRELEAGGYEVVAPPVDDAPAAAGHYVYPRNGQSADRQASDEYECHRWAVQRTGFDPSSVATGTARGGSDEQRAAYPRARDACLEGRGYSVR